MRPLYLGAEASLRCVIRRTLGWLTRRYRDDVTDDVLQMIDRAIEDCTVSGDAMRWTPTIAPPAEQREAVLAMFREFGARMDAVVDGFVAWAGEAVIEIEANHPYLITTTPPEPIDPMQRALEARRNRNTGPPARLRAPRRVDATRAR